MISAWDFVTPTRWFALGYQEQSLMDEQCCPSQNKLMRQCEYPMTREMLAVPNPEDDDDFFRDLPVDPRKPKTDQPVRFAYSFMEAAVVDDDGNVIESVRRRYEDASGRLKAIHERKLKGKSLKSFWSRQHKHDKGLFDIICSEGKTEEFEAEWSKTPFAKLLLK